MDTVRDWYPVVLFVSQGDLVENLRRGYSQLLKEDCCARVLHAVVHFLYQRPLLSVVVILLHQALPYVFCFS